MCFIKDISRLVELHYVFLSHFHVGYYNQFVVLFFRFQFDRPTSVDFREYVEAAFKGVPPYGYIFAAELNQKYLRAIRIDSEVSWKPINGFYCFIYTSNGLIMFYRHQICHFVFVWLILVKRFLYRLIWHYTICAIKQNDFHRWQFFATLKRYDNAFYLPQFMHGKGKTFLKCFDMFSTTTKNGSHQHIILNYVVCHFRSMAKYWIHWRPFTRKHSMFMWTIFACKFAQWKHCTMDELLFSELI